MGFWGNRKPPYGTPIDRSHPLSKGLVFAFPFNEQAGSGAYDVVTPGGYNAPIVRQTSGNPWRYPGYLLPTTADSALSGAIPSAWKLQPPISLLWQGNATATNSNNIQTYIFGIIYSQPDVSPWIGTAFYSDAGRGIVLQHNNAGTQVQKLYGVASDGDTKKHQLVGIWSPTTLDGSSYNKGFYDGIAKTSDTSQISSITYTSTSWLLLGQVGNLNTELVALYNRVLPVDQQNWLNAEPFDHFAAPRNNRRMVLLSGSAAYSQTASGGVTQGGHPGPAANYSVTGSGGMSRGGAAGTQLKVLSVRFDYFGDVQGFIPNAGPNSTMTWNGATGNPKGSLSTALTGSGVTNNDSWTLTTTWANLGVPSDATVIGVNATSMDSRCTAFTGGVGCTMGAVTLADGTTVITLSAQRSISSTDSAWVNVAGSSVSGMSKPATDSITITIPSHLATTAGGSGKGVTVLHDNLAFTIVYTRNYQNSSSGGMRHGGAITSRASYSPLHSGGLARGGHSAGTRSASPTASGGVTWGSKLPVFGSTIVIAGMHGPQLVTAGLVGKVVVPVTGSTIVIDGLGGSLYFTGGYRGPFTFTGSTIVIDGLGGKSLATSGFRSPNTGYISSMIGGLSRGGSAKPQVAYSPTRQGGERVGGSPPTSSATVIIPSGGEIISGIKYTYADYTAFPSGGESFGGHSVAISPHPTIQAKGGMSMGGASSMGADYVVSGRGGESFGGSPTTGPFNTYTITAIGGTSHGGHAEPTASYSTANIGGIKLGGHVPTGSFVATSGGMNLGGSGSPSHGNIIIGSGGMAQGGLQLFPMFLGTVTIIFGLEGPRSVLGGFSGGGTNVIFPSGGMSMGGNAIQATSHVVRQSGGMRIGGERQTSADYTAFPSGGISRGGAIAPLPDVPHVGTGGMNLSGNANISTGSLVIISSGFGGSAEPTVFPELSPQKFTKFTDVAKAMGRVVTQTGEYNSNNLIYVMDPNDIDTWPLVDPPFCTIFFGDAISIPQEVDGGGRFTQSFTQEVILGLAFRNIMNTPFNDSSPILSENEAIGAYAKVHAINSGIIQACPVYSDGKAVLREPIIVRSVSSPRRYKKTYEFILIRVHLEISWDEDLGDIPMPRFPDVVIPRLT